MDIKYVQEYLKTKGFDPGPIDNIRGPRTVSAMSSYLRDQKVPYYYRFATKRREVMTKQLILKSLDLPVGEIDGYIGPQTRLALEQFKHLRISGSKPKPWRDNEFNKVDWPHQSRLTEFYGPRGSDQVKLYTPFKMKLAWNPRQEITRFSCHRKVHDSLMQILTKTKDHYGEKEIQHLRLDHFGGCLNVRKIRGGSTWSTHSWGIAIDIDPANNQLRWGRDKAWLSKPRYFDFLDIINQEGWTSLGQKRNYDWMHFQAARI